MVARGVLMSLQCGGMKPSLVAAWQIYDDGHNYVFYGMSIEKGTFNDVYLRTEGKKFDVSKLDVKAMEMPNGDNIITEILYNGEPLDGDFGDTNGKGYVCDVWDY